MYEVIIEIIVFSVHLSEMMKIFTIKLGKKDSVIKQNHWCILFKDIYAVNHCAHFLRWETRKVV